jgi:hypothetical protein
MMEVSIHQVIAILVPNNPTIITTIISTIRATILYAFGSTIKSTIFFSYTSERDYYL